MKISLIPLAHHSLKVTNNEKNLNTGSSLAMFQQMSKSRHRTFPRLPLINIYIGQFPSEQHLGLDASMRIKQKKQSTLCGHSICLGHQAKRHTSMIVSTPFKRRVNQGQESEKNIDQKVLHIEIKTEEAF